MDSIRERTLRLLERVSWPPGESRMTGATLPSIREFGRRTQMVIPQDLEEWLQVVNGARIGPGGVLGIQTPDSYCDIETVLAGYPEWRKRGWLPIAGDGCGNFYVVLANMHSAPVVFIDTIADYLHPAYIVASGVWIFLWFLLGAELGETEWPFSEEFVTRTDPAIVEFGVAPLPWEA